MDRSYLIEMAVLGLVGFDPSAAAVAILSLAAGVQRRVVLAFLTTVWALTAVFAVVAALTIGRNLADIDWTELLRRGPVPAAIEIVLALALTIWVWRRVSRPVVVKESSAPRRTVWQAVLLGVGFALAWVIDPGFDLAVLRAGEEGGVTSLVTGILLWSVVAQVITLGLFVGLLVVADPAAPARYLAPKWAATAGLRRRLVTAGAALSAAALLVDAGWYLATGAYLFDPTG